MPDVIDGAEAELAAEMGLQALRDARDEVDPAGKKRGTDGPVSPEFAKSVIATLEADLEKVKNITIALVLRTSEARGLLAALDCRPGLAMKVRAFAKRLEADAAAMKKAQRNADSHAPPGADEATFNLLRLTQRLKVMPTLGNAITILDTDPRQRGRIRYSEFASRIEIDDKPITDDDEGELTDWLEKQYDASFTLRIVHDALITVAARHRHHPVRDWLDALPPWDGIDRLDKMLTDHFGCEDDELSAVYGRKFMIGLVARVLKPGCKNDVVLIFKGRQGALKSSSFRDLCPRPEWFADSALEIGKKDSYINMRGVLVYELGELGSLTKSDIEGVKAFLASQVDRYRPPYGRNQQEFPRQTVFVGTTNEEEFLNDPTGSRRFWVRKVIGDINLENIRECREQLFAEALHRYLAKEKWWLEEEEEEERRVDAEQHEVPEPWLQLVVPALERAKKNARLHESPKVTLVDILTAQLGVLKADVSDKQTRRLAKVMRRLGWEPAPRERVPAAQRQAGAALRPRFWQPAVKGVVAPGPAGWENRAEVDHGMVEEER